MCIIEIVQFILMKQRKRNKSNLERIMNMTLKTCLTNQLRRKLNFLFKPIQRKNKSAYTSKVMTYAKYYKKNNVKEYQILYQVRDGKSITDSPYAIFKSLIQQPRYRKYKHIWVVDHHETLLFYKARFKYYKNVEFVIKESREYLKALTESKYLINNSTFPSYFIKKPKQMYINTWHGTPLKYMGLDIENSLYGSQNIIKNFLSSDYLISPNHHTTTIFKRAFRLENIYGGEFLEIGYPRIDLTLNSNRKDMISELNHYLHISKEQSILLYCPTWRGEDVNAPEASLNHIVEEVEKLKHHLDYQVLVKVHPYLYKDALKIKRLKPYLIPDYFDTNEILAIVDLMITDYSSIFFDYLVTNKPIVFYTPDLDEYQSSRGMYIANRDLPGPVVHHIEDVITAIKQKVYDDDSVKKKYQYFKRQYTYLDDGTVTETLINILFEGKRKRPKRKICAKKRVLIYPGGMKNNGITTSIINLLENVDYEKYDVTLFTNKSKNLEVLNNLNRINKNVRIILRVPPLAASLKEMYSIDFVRQRGLKSTLEHLIYPKKVYEREMRKVFGHSQFDYAIDFSGYSMFWANLILATKVKRKLIYLHSDIKADMERKVNGVKIHYQNLKGVLSLYSQFDQLVCVSDASKDQNKQKINDKSLNKKFVTSRNTINLNKINQLKLDDSEKFEKQHQSVLVRINNRDISSVPFKEDDFKIVTAGRLSPEKGFDLLIEAFSKVHVSHPHTKLYIMGEGPIRVQLEQQIKRLKLEKHVFLLGQRKNPYYIMKQADVFCLTSHYEGQSMVLLEALTLKVHIIASDIIANRYVLGNGKYGTLVSHDIDDITVALEQCIQKRPSQYEVFNAQEYNQLALKEFYKLLK